MEHEEYWAMLGANTMAASTVLLETGVVLMQEPTTKMILDAPAGLVAMTADCEAGKVKAVDLGLHPANGRELVDIGERIKRAIQAQTDPVHPENPAMRGVTILEFTEPLITSEAGKVATNTVVVSPGRVDRSPCGTGTCARLAALRKRGQLGVGESFTHRSIIGTEFQGTVRRETKIGEYDAIMPAVKGTAWITAFKQVIPGHSAPYGPVSRGIQSRGQMASKLDFK
ncbi:hypothetical protein KJ359_009139 [Pestalotiopsis sp. 9143b]|nr:hypothetical protein KJ359_009139 [Pestalotiopsis sp. 9143b]